MSWQRFKEQYLSLPELDFALDISRMNLPAGFMEKMGPKMDKAFSAMEALEGGAIANPDESRMVGHYWLRNPSIAPSQEISGQIEETLQEIKDFAEQVHSGEVRSTGGRFTDLLVVGIGGSALGPQFVAQALGGPGVDRLSVSFLDNTDPDGMAIVLSHLGDRLETTLVIVISKSGGTPETRNGMLETQAAYKRAGLDFARHAIAVTGEGSKLDQVAEEEEWLAKFPMWDWVGGRTSETGPVGLIVASLQGIPIDPFLKGAADMDEATRVKELGRNPAALLAIAWFYATGGKGERDMVLLPYKDRLELFSRYLQQLVMESLGKERDLEGNVVHQGIAVYGNKGSTDQHAYVQQLREGVNNFFVTFIEVLRDQEGEPLEVEPDTTSGDYLQGFLLGTRDALSDNGRESITITIGSVTPRSVGMLIALYERAVGLYASLIGINAYHQPGVEAGKKAAASILDTKRRIQDLLRDKSPEALTAEQVSSELSLDNPETAFKLLEHLAANSAKRVRREAGDSIERNTYRHE